MRSSAFVALALLATAAPTFAAPVATTATNTPPTTGSSTTTAGAATVSLTPEQSAALSLGTIGTIVGLAGSALSGIIDHFKNNGSQQQRRDALELEGLLARATDESGAFALSDVASIASIASDAVDIFHGLFGGKSRREFNEYLARADVDGSEALSLSSIAGIASIGGGIFDVLHSIFSGNSQQRRELAELLARQATDDQSAALSLGTIGTIVSLAGSALSGIIDHFKNNGSQQQRRDALELEGLLARATDESGAFALGDVANVAGIASHVVDIFHSLFGGNSRREFNEYLARADVDGSEALSLSSIAGIASIGGGIFDVLHSIFSGNSQQRRELAELLARQATDDQSAALSLGTIGTIVGLAGSALSGIIDHFKNNGSQQQRRDALALEQLLARADVDESGAISFGTIKDIGSIASSAFSIFHDIFGGSDNNQRRELIELLARTNALNMGKPLKGSGSLNDLD